jgi:signal transduction histidine kinase
VFLWRDRDVRLHLKHDIEPGILRVFQRFTLLAWLILSPAWFFLLMPHKLPNYLALFCWMQYSLLGLYLSFSWLQRVLRGLYLPLALSVAAIGPVVFQLLAAKIRIDQGVPNQEALQPNPGSLYFWLLLPLLLIGMQYGYRVLLGFTLGTSGLSVLLVNLLTPAESALTTTVAEQAMTRFLMFTLAGAIIVRLSKLQRLQRQELIQKNRQLTYYATTLEQLALSRERDRLARELHDTLAHTLSAVSVQLKALEVLWDNPDSAHQTLAKTQELTRHGLHEARRALSALRAGPLEELGLGLALKQLVEQLTERSHLQVKLEISSQLNDLRPEVEQQVYRIMEEGLNNVIQHSSAKTVEISLEKSKRNLYLQIADDGIGFNPEKSANVGHYGLLGMQERAHLIDGKLTIFSKSQQGTTIKLDVNL